MFENIYPVPPITPPSDHPRLMLRRKDFERVKENINKESPCGAQRVFCELLSLEIKGEGANPDFGTYHLKEYMAIEAKALKALLDGDKEQGRAVVEELLLLLRTVSYNGTIMMARFSGHLIFISSVVYDWCYYWLSDDEKNEIIDACEKLAGKYFEMGYPPVRQSAISGHGTEAQLLRDLLSFAIAVYDERPDIYNFCAGRLFREYIPTYEKVFTAEFHPQGPSYGAYRHTGTMWFGLLIYAMSGERVLPACVENIADSFLYLTRSDGEMLRLGDDCNEGKAVYSQKNPFGVPLFLTAAYTGNRAYYDEALRQLHPSYIMPSHYSVDYYEEGSYGEGLMSASVYLIWDGIAQYKEAESIPPARYFGSPVGCTVYNDGERLVFMKIGELWGANHDHLDTGCFQIYDGEILASDSGVYDAYHTPHRMNYYIHTVAHNCLLVGGKGTRFPYDLEEPRNPDHWFSDFVMAKVTYHSEEDGKYVIEGDLTAAYSEKCELVTRRMCWEPQRGERGIFTVKDTVISKNEEDVTFLIHCQSEPEIKEDVIIINGRRRRLVCRVKSPEKVNIISVAGPGRAFEKDGVNYEPKSHTAEEGFGRVEISATGKKVEFLVECEIERV